MPIAVASVDDPRLAPYRALTDPLALRDRGLFVAEGRLTVERLVAAGSYALESVLLTPAAATALAHVVAAVPADVPVYVAPQAAMNAVAGFNIHRGCLALARRPAPRTLGDLALGTRRRLLLAEGVNNPDNVGSLFRNALALGADAVVLGPHCADPLYRKAIRTSMAATLLLPWAESAAWPDDLDRLRGDGFAVIACRPAAEATPVHDVAWPVRAAVLVGAERDGLSAQALARADLQVRIPMHGAMDSLNVATAAAVVLAALDATRRW